MLEKPSGAFYDRVIGNSWIDIDENIIQTQMNDAQTLNKVLDQQTETTRSDLGKYLKACDGEVFDNVKDVYQKIASAYNSYSEASAAFAKQAAELYHLISKGKKEIIDLANNYHGEIAHLSHPIEITKLVNNAKEEIATAHENTMSSISSVIESIKNILNSASNIGLSV